MIELICIGCGCTDEHACPGGCEWIRQDPLAGVGVCSACPASVEAGFDAGERELAEEALEHRAELSAELEADLAGQAQILLPGDYAYEETVHEMRRR
jgi:hypothetical protein